MKDLKIVFIGFLSLTYAFSQSISGEVTDIDGNPLDGANIKVKGTDIGSSSDSNGSYTITGIDSGKVQIEVTYIGYSKSTKRAQIKGDDININFTLRKITISGDGVFVTGTRSSGRSSMKSPTPIDGFDSMSLRRQGNGDLTETLKNQVPSFSATPLTGDGSAFVRSTSMRGLPSDNVLVLTNSKRRHRSALIAHFGSAMNVGAQGSDIGMIPSIAIKRLEVLRDGASAQYGSDAIAGVMNMMLKDNAKGLEIQVTNGMWMQAPNGRGWEKDLTAAANIGLPLRDQGFLNLSAEYSIRPELSRGQQHASALDGYKGWDSTLGVDDKDNVDDWQTAMNWGRPENNGFRSVWNAGLNVSDGIEAYSFGNYADTYGEYSFFLRDTGNKALNAVPLDPTDPTAGNFSWSDTYPLGFTPRLEGHGTDFSSVLGIRGKSIAGIDLNYDLSTSYGTHYLHYFLRNSLNSSWGPYSPHDFEVGDLQQEETNLNADFVYPLGQLNIAFGAEWREEKYIMYEGQKESWMAGPWAKVHTLAYDSLGTGTMVNYGYAAPELTVSGMPGTNPDEAGEFARQNTAFYTDVEYGMNDLLVQAAVRFEDFSDFGGTSNFKIAARYSFNNYATLRGNFSTGFRAPTPGQSNYTGVVTSFDGVTGTQINEGTLKPTDALSLALGGAALVPEESQNISVGLTSSYIENLNLSLDYYSIDITNKIIKSRNLPVEGNSEFSNLAFYTNALDTKTSGVDLVATYTFKWGTKLGIAINSNKTEVKSQNQVNDLDPVSSATIFNLENNLPELRISANVEHSFSDVLALMVRINHYGETIDERSDKEKVDPAQLLDIELTYKISSNMEVVLGGNNVLNAYPTEIETRLSQGMPYPRRTPIGYHGGMIFTRLNYNF
tara:strand:+ start:767 stop:3436 length:2670 start_codon:yes stop_codon:yes gene_type:complete